MDLPTMNNYGERRRSRATAAPSTTFGGRIRAWLTQPMVFLCFLFSSIRAMCTSWVFWQPDSTAALVAAAAAERCAEESTCEVSPMISRLVDYLFLLLVAPFVIILLCINFCREGIDLLLGRRRKTLLHIKLMHPGLPETAAGPGAAPRRSPWSCWAWLKVLAFALLTFDFGMGIYGAHGDPWGIAFASFSYVALVLLFFYLKPHERVLAAPSSSSSARTCAVRASVWVLTLLLAVLVGWKIADVMPLPVAAIVWVLALAALVGIFYAFFAEYEEEEQVVGDTTEEAPDPEQGLSGHNRRQENTEEDHHGQNN
ncbi:hypothetical protein ACP4OV_009270 [Aristida adscensionis]